MVLIGERERKMFLLLFDMVFLDIDFLHRVVYEDMLKTSVYHKIRKLKNEGYLKTFSTLRLDGKGLIKIVTLDRLGVEEVEGLTGKNNWDSRWTKRVPAFIHHSLQLAEIRSSFEKEKKEDFILQEWLSERESFFSYGEGKNDVIRPDGTLVFERRVKGQAGLFAYFMEFERSRKHKHVNRDKLLRYNEYLRRGGPKRHPIFDVPPVVTRVCFVAITEEEMLDLMEDVKNVSTDHIQAVIFSTYSEVLENPYGEIWRLKGGGSSRSFMWKIN